MRLYAEDDGPMPVRPYLGISPLGFNFISIGYSGWPERYVTLDRYNPFHAWTVAISIHETWTWGSKLYRLQKSDVPVSAELECKQELKPPTIYLAVLMLSSANDVHLWVTTLVQTSGETTACLSRTDGTARGESELAQAIPSRDRGRQMSMQPRVAQFERKGTNLLLYYGWLMWKLWHFYEYFWELKINNGLWPE